MPKLTAVAVRNAGVGMHGDGDGLWLRVRANGRKFWCLRYMLSGKAREMGLGPTTLLSLAEARDRARDQRRLLKLESVDPIDTRRAKRLAAKASTAKAMTFQQCAEAYIRDKQAGWRNAKHAAQWGSTLETYVYPVFGKLPVETVDLGLVRKAIDPIWTTKPETASRVRGRIESILGWATTSGYRKGENPARWRGHLENLLAQKSKVRAVEHHAALPYVEIGAFMGQLREQDSMSARALEFAILTTARTGEVIGARWSEFNIAERLWTVPAERMKAGKEHRVPLSNAALAIIEKMAAIRSSEFVFQGQRAGAPLSNMALLMTLRRMKRDDLTAHGFRSTFRDWAAERTSFPAEVAEMALAHVVGDKVEAAYRRGDLFEKRRQLAEAWAKFCAAPTITGKVVPIRSVAAE